MYRITQETTWVMDVMEHVTFGVIPYEIAICFHPFAGFVRRRALSIMTSRHMQYWGEVVCI